MIKKLFVLNYAGFVGAVIFAFPNCSFIFRAIKTPATVSKTVVANTLKFDIFKIFFC